MEIQTKTHSKNIPMTFLRLATALKQCILTIPVPRTPALRRAAHCWRHILPATAYV